MMFSYNHIDNKKLVRYPSPQSSSPLLGLWPKIPLKNAGIRIEPPISEPIPSGDPAAACKQPSPPEEPPTICLKMDNDEIRNSCRVKSYYDFCHTFGFIMIL